MLTWRLRDALYADSPGQQVIDGLAIVEVGQLFEQRSEINTWRYIIGFSGFNQAVQHGTGLGTTATIGEQPVFPADNERLNGPLGAVVINRH